MKIAIDLRPLLEKNRAGVSLYTLNLVQQLTNRGAHNYALFCNSSRGEFPNDTPTGSRVQHHFFRYPNRLLNAAFSFLKHPRIETLIPDGADLIYLPNLNFIATNRPYIVTVHDLSFKHFAKFFSIKQRLWHQLIATERLIKNAAAVVAVSAHTKDDIIENYHVRPELVHIVTPAAASDYRPQTSEAIAVVRKKYGLAERFVLFLGTLEPRKNVVGLIEAFAALNTNAELVLAGGRGWLYQKIFAAARRSPCRERIKFLGYVSEEDKPALYAAATVFAYPSFYEGFGMPVLEAMSCSTPVVASYTSSLGEVVGDAGLLINPSDKKEIALAIGELLSDQNLHRELSRRGLEQAKKFSWEKSAADLEKIFSSYSTVTDFAKFRGLSGSNPRDTVV